MINKSPLFLVCLIMTASSMLTQADIADFNNAMRAGDHQAASAETNSIWQGYDKTSDAAATVAREFAFVNYLAGKMDEADRFLEHFSGDTQPQLQDDQPVVTAVLSAMINYRRSPSDQSLEMLGDALTDRLELTGGVDNISLVGADLLYMSAWQQGKWEDTQEYASLGLTLFEQGGDQLLSRQYMAGVVKLAAAFLFNPRRSDTYDDMVDMHNAIVDSMDSDSNREQREELLEIKWMAQAWANSMEVLHTSYYPKTGSLIDRSIKSKELKESKYGYFKSGSTGDNQVLCDVEFNADKLRYPSLAAFKGMVGTVITKMDFDEKGQVTDADLLASVPTRYFADSVMEKTDTYRLKKSDEEQQNCTLAIDNRVQVFSFMIQ